MSLDEINLVVLGDKGCNKSALTNLYVQGIFIEQYDPTAEDDYKKQEEVDGKTRTLIILDTAGTESFSAMRDLYVKNAHGVMLVYSINDRNTFNSIHDHHELVLRIKDVNSVPCVVVGIALNTESLSERQVSYDDGVQLAKSINASFFEVNIRQKVNIRECFVHLAHVALASQPTDKKKSKGGLFSRFRHSKKDTDSSTEPVDPESLFKYEGLEGH